MDKDFEEWTTQAIKWQIEYKVYPDMWKVLI